MLVVGKPGSLVSPSWWWWWWWTDMIQGNLKTSMRMTVEGTAMMTNGHWPSKDDESDLPVKTWPGRLDHDPYKGRCGGVSCQPLANSLFLIKMMMIIIFFIFSLLAHHPLKNDTFQKFLSKVFLPSSSSTDSSFACLIMIFDNVW